MAPEVSALLARIRTARFPLAPPTWPTTVQRPDPERKVGLDYDHEWSRRYPVRLARAMVMDNVTRPAARVLAPATVRGLEHLQHLDGPVIFAANHASHIDTPLLLTTLPVELRHRTVVAAASDYFFDRTWKSVLWSFALAAIPIERSRVNRRSADTAAAVIEDGWNLVIFPEGGRSPDGWTQPFRGGAAYLARRTGRPVVPVYLHGTRHVLPKASESGAKAPGGSGTESRRGGRLRRSPSPCCSGLRCPPTRARAPTASRTGWKARWPRWPARSSRTGGRPGGRSAPWRPSRGPRPPTAARRPPPGAGRGRSTNHRHAAAVRSGRTDRALSTDPGVVRGAAPGHQPTTDSRVPVVPVVPAVPVVPPVPTAARGVPDADDHPRQWQSAARPQRAGPSTLVRTEAGDLLFDCGRGVLMRAAAAASGAGALRGLFLTHLHSDHTTDLNDVVTSRWVMSFQPSPLRVFGPPGTASLLTATEAMLELDIGYRMAHHADLNWRPSADVVECEHGQVLAEQSVRITVAPTDHAPVRPTVGYRVEEEGRCGRDRG